MSLHSTPFHCLFHPITDSFSARKYSHLHLLITEVHIELFVLRCLGGINLPSGVISSDPYGIQLSKTRRSSINSEIIKEHLITNSDKIIRQQLDYIWSTDP
jgi:hypothetical protein